MPNRLIAHTHARRRRSNGRLTRQSGNSDAHGYFQIKLHVISMPVFQLENLIGDMICAVNEKKTADSRL